MSEQLLRDYACGEQMYSKILRHRFKAIVCVIT